MEARELPGGTVTLLFTDIEGSTRMLQELGRETYVRALTAHRRLLREAFTAHGGVEIEMQGDSFHFAFPYARDAVAAAVEGQRAMYEHEWASQPIRVRMGLHTGEPIQADGLYAGLDVHRAARVMSAGHGGQVLLSQQTAELVDGELPAAITLLDLGEHRLKDLTVPQKLYQALADGLPAKFPLLKSLAEWAPYIVSLPTPPTPLLGRERELAELTARLATLAVRLLTITGPGGIGKTRVAVELAHRLADQYPDGVWFVDLSALRDPALVLPTVQRVLGADGNLSSALAGKRSLLVLDNLEQVLDAAAELGELLAACSELRVLATSREPLHLSGEHEYPLAPLPDIEAAALFFERARAIEPDFAVNDEVAAICRRLDGLPLAIELAAARVKLLSPTQILTRLEHKLPLLTTGARDLPDRQRTLRATIDWSHELLSEEEKRLFARLSVFAGGCDLDAAEAVCGAQLDTLQALVDKNLVRARGERFTMLETIREYAEEELTKDPAKATIRHGHAAYFAELAEQAYDGWAGPDSVQIGDRLEIELDNVRAALRVAIDQPYPRLALLLASKLVYLWSERGRRREGLAWNEAADAIAEGEDAGVRAVALRVAGGLAGELSELKRSRELLDKAMEFGRDAGDDTLVARIEGNLGVADIREGDFTSGIKRLLAAAAFFREKGDQLRVAICLGNVACARLTQGEDHDAAETAREVLELCRELKWDVLTAWVLATSGWAELGLGNIAEAEAAFGEALDLSARSPDPNNVIAGVEGFAACAVRGGKLGRSARLFAAATIARRHRDIPQQSMDALVMRPYLQELTDAAGDCLDDLWKEGEALSLEDATDYALRRESPTASVEAT